MRRRRRSSRRRRTVFAGNTLQFKQFPPSSLYLSKCFFRSTSRPTAPARPSPDADESLCAVLTFFQPFDLFRNRPENSFVRALTELEMAVKTLEKVFYVSGSYSISALVPDADSILSPQQLTFGRRCCWTLSPETSFIRLVGWWGAIKWDLE